MVLQPAAIPAGFGTLLRGTASLATSIRMCPRKFPGNDISHPRFTPLSSGRSKPGRNTQFLFTRGYYHFVITAKRSDSLPKNCSWTFFSEIVTRSLSKNPLWRTYRSGDPRNCLFLQVIPQTTMDKRNPGLGNHNSGKLSYLRHTNNSL